MSSALSELLEMHDRLFTYPQALQRVGEKTLYRWVGAGSLHRLWPGVFTSDLHDEHIRKRGALLYAGADAVLSHETALRGQGVQPHEANEASPVIHLTIAQNRMVAPQPGLRLHRTRDIRCWDCTRRVRQLPTAGVEFALLQTWNSAPETARAWLMAAVAGRATTVDKLREEADQWKRVKQRGQMRQVMDMIEQGCHSELEMMGLSHVFNHPSLPTSRGQVWVNLPSGGRARLDRFFEAEAVAVELDGAAWHNDARRRRDIARDRDLHSLGIVVLRYTYEEIAYHPDWVVAQLSHVLAQRIG